MPHALDHGMLRALSIFQFAETMVRYFANIHRAAFNVLDSFAAACCSELFLLRLDDPQRRVHIVADSTILEGDANMAIILEKTNLYQTRQTISIKGFQYELGDFSIRLGNLSLSAHARAVVVEVEYRPCLQTNKCMRLISEFVGAVLGPLEQAPAQFLASIIRDDIDWASVGLSTTTYSARHTAYQYVLLFKLMRLLK